MSSNSKQSVSRPATREGYFDLHVRGAGYMSRIRIVKGRTGNKRAADETLAVTIRALRGHYGGEKNIRPESTTLDLIVTGEDAKGLVSELMALDNGGLVRDVNDNRAKVFVSFLVGDFYAADPYQQDVWENNQKTGEKKLVSAIKGVGLLRFDSIAIDGENFYTRERPVSGSTDDGQPDQNGDRSQQHDGPQDQRAPDQADPDPRANAQGSASMPDQEAGGFPESENPGHGVDGGDFAEYAEAGADDHHRQAAAPARATRSFGAFRSRRSNGQGR